MAALHGSEGGDASSATGRRSVVPGGRSRRRILIAAGAAGVAVVALGAAAVSGGGGAQPTAAASRATATTSIRQQDLVESEDVDGTLGYSDSRTVVNRLAGTLTWTPRVGSVVKTNDRLYKVDGSSVYLLDGSYPAYRTLRAGLTGDDVRQLERNLRRLGLDDNEGMTVDGTWDAGTTAAVKRWQSRKGMQQDGTIEEGRIVFQPGSRRIGKITLPVGSSASGAGEGGGRSPASYQSDKAPRTIFASAPADLGTARGFSDLPAAEATPATRPPAPITEAPTQTPTAPKAGKPKPQSPGTCGPTPSGGGAAGGRARGGRGAGAPASRAAGGDGGRAPGSGAPPGSEVAAALMTTTSTRRIVAVDLETTKQDLASDGGEVTVELPDGDDVAGTIARVGKVAQKKATPQDEDPPATIRIVIELKKSTGTGLDQAPVDVKLEKRRAKDVLVVPVTALLARAGGEFAVEVRAGNRRRVVAVETGLYTDSYVEIEGKGLRDGLKVSNAAI